MNALNSIILEGYVTKKEIRNNVCIVTMGSDRHYKDTDGNSITETSYFDIEAYGNLAEICNKNCTEGRDIRVVGRLKQSRWTSDGKEYSKVVVVAEHFEFKPAK